MKDTIQFEGGNVHANLEERTITGLLLPFNEVGRTNIGRFQVEAGTIDVPTDPLAVGINTDHVREAGVGRAIKLDVRAEGVFATFQFAKTPAGDAALADAISPTGKRRKLSAEFGPAIVKGGKLVAGHAKLWGAALVTAGAFPSAQVLAEDTPDDEIDPDEEPTDEGTITLESGYSSKTTEQVEDLGDGRKRITRTTISVDEITEEPPADPAEDDTEGGSTVTAKAVPVTQRTGAPATVTKDRPVDLRQVFAAIAAVKANPSDADATQVLAALKDIKMATTGTGALLGDGVLQPDWVGQLNQGISYVREYINLGKLGTSITAGGKKGYKIGRGTKAAPVTQFDGNWAGNKTELNSYAGFTETAGSTLRKFAIGEDIAREFYDLPGGIDIVEAFMRLLVEDHARWSDTAALNDWITAAGTPVAAKVYPGVDGHDYSSAMGKVIQGILAVKGRKADGRRDVPTFAIANAAAYEELVYTPKDLIPEYVTFSVNTDGNGTADGKVHIVQGETGIEDTSSVIVGADYAIEFDELAGGPLQIDALDIAKGGVDKAVHGYLQTFIVRPEAVVLIGTPDLP